ncbi:MAG: hypothetical protein DRJ40_03900 [Thermoprotei archaeon]|mgnify:CR=1 FL=1|nr:MAG: hypothetical protein DRJ40_03900 [Thermoprotei archaeon]
MKRRFRVVIDGKVFEVEVEDNVLNNVRELLRTILQQCRPGITRAEVGVITSPIPARVVEVRVAEGCEVKVGDVVTILESMKSIIEVKAPMSGIVTKVFVKPGQVVKKGDPLVKIEVRR